LSAEKIVGTYSAINGVRKNQQNTAVAIFQPVRNENGNKRIKRINGTHNILNPLLMSFLDMLLNGFY
jgi:hypothetical protein